jgi:hypothetical protein
MTTCCILWPMCRRRSSAQAGRPTSPVPSKIAALEKDLGYRHYGRAHRAAQLRRIQAEPVRIEQIERDLRRTHIPFRRIEALRVALAKHEVVGQPNSPAFTPGYGRINSWCGALDFELSTDRGIIGLINRRDIADDLRGMANVSEPPSVEELKAFDKMMKGPAERNG